MIGDHCKIGDSLTLGDACTIEGVKVIKMIQIQNLDGSNRQVNIIKHEEGMLIRAGCFIGTPEEFCAKAEAEGKATYVAVVSAICRAL